MLYFFLDLSGCIAVLRYRLHLFKLVYVVWCVCSPSYGQRFCGFQSIGSSLRDCQTTVRLERETRNTRALRALELYIGFWIDPTFPSMVLNCNTFICGCIFKNIRFLSDELGFKCPLPVGATGVFQVPSPDAPVPRYDILALPRGCSKEDIKPAFRILPNWALDSPGINLELANWG